MNSEEKFNDLIKRLVKYKVCPEEIGLTDKAIIEGGEFCKKEHCNKCWKDSIIKGTPI